ncbi:RNA polymerase sigma factor SigJ [Microbacterium sp. bgisy189]|uniref:RNA polymerase sigma factor SigJ n=1 Tax=Microbacterium sp. bgisy189 TaxID=3413798 RepID=UPI003EBAC495
MTTFDDERPRLLGIAYRLLGSFADAEDVVQETWIAWNEVGAASVDNPAAYLAKAVTHRALNRIRTLARRREDYIGDWLPEPVSSARLPDEAAEIADSVSFAMLVMLERLSPLERAAFILRDVFDVSTADVADTLERSPEAVRKLVSRARSRLKDDPPDDADTASHTRTSLAFADAVQRGDVEAALALLSPTVEFIADSGGRARASRRPIVGADNVLRFLLGALTKWQVDAINAVDVNRRTALLVLSASDGDGIYQVAVRDGLIERIWATRNPDKLSAVSGP